MKYIISASSKNGSESTKFEFEYETNEELTLSTLITNADVVGAAVRNCPATPTARAEVQGLSFERLRHFLIQPVDLKQR